MPRNLLILALLVSGTGCSSSRPLLSTIVVTPPRVSFRQLSREDASHWNAVAVTYPAESLIPAPCSPSPIRSVELVTFFEEDECPAPPSPSGPIPSVTTVVPVPPVNAPALPTIVHIENATSLQSAHLPVQSVALLPIEITPLVQTAVAVTYPSGSLLPSPCAPAPVRPVEMAAFFQPDNHTTPRSSRGPVPSPIVQTASTLLAPPVRMESPIPTESHWKPATRIAFVSPTQTSTAMRCDQDETTLAEARHVKPVESLSAPVQVQPDFSELMTEIRNQRQLIESLQRDLLRERSADDAAIDELEAAVESLLVQTNTAPHEMPTTLRK